MKQNVEEARGFSDEDLDLLASFLAEEGVELEGAVIPRRAPGVPVPLSFGQQRLWFLEQLQPANPVYNLPTGVRVRGRLEVAALEQTFSEIVRRHEILRTTFSTIGGTPQQLIAPAQPVSFPLVELSQLSAAEREVEAQQLTRAEISRPFDLSHGPLWRTLLLRLSADEHIVIVTMHHIISDGWSSAILVREIAALYEAFVSRRPAPLAELPLQYGDFASWEQERQQGAELKSQLDYWRRQLDQLPVLSLPLDRARPAVQRFNGAKQHLLVSPATSDALKALAQSEQATLFMVLLAAFSVLLSRYSGQTDITIGTPIANRRRTELEALIGFFANTLVLRLDIADCATFRELVRRAREVCLGAYANQDVPFEKLVEELQPERSLSHTPLFQTVLVLQNVPRKVLRLPDLQLEGFAAEAGLAKFDLTLVVEETDSGLACTLEYNKDLFDASTTERLLSQWRTLLEAAAANPEQSPVALPLLAAAQRRELLAQWNGSGADFRRHHSLHQLFEAQVARTPDAVALTLEQQQVTYAELNARANRLARYLRAQSVGPETLVALCLERSLEMMVAILAVLKAGAAYVPLEPANPKERLAFMLDDTKTPVLLTQQHLLEHLPQFTGLIVTLDNERELFQHESDDNLDVLSTPEHTAYVIYTSGSTGRAKGTYITHANVTRLFAATDQWFHFSSVDVWTLFHSYAFDFSVWELWGALLYGGRLVIVPYWISRTPDAFYHLLAIERVTVLNQTPTAFRQLMHVEETLTSALALRLIIFGGEALEPASLKPWVERHGDELPQLINMYGITETTVHVTYRRLRRSEVESAANSVIGLPIPDLQVYVLDQMMELAPPGVTGEMYVGGEGLARGYLARPALTAERFIPNPFSNTPGARLYRTGDLARYVGSELQYLGRCDQQVKIRGFRIELGEIQSVLAAHPAVREASVIDLPDSNNERRLVAYLTLKETVTADQLRAFAKQQLPEHMLPAAFVILDQLPLTANGKLDRRALPPPETTQSDASYVGPRTAAEEIMASIWADVLELERVGIHDNFFALGGDSIRSVRLLAQARERGLEFSLQQLFRHQTIAELAHEIAATENSSLALRQTKPFELVSEGDREKMPPNVVDAYPLTMMQGGMLFHMALAPETTVYHNLNSWHLRASFDRERFEEAVARAVARHPILRTYFDLTSYSEPLQLVQDSATLPVSITDLRQNSEEQQTEMLDQYVEVEKSRGFDIGQAPLLRFHIHLRTEESFQFSLTESHPIFDGWSLNSTLAEIFTDYFALLKGQTLPPPSPMSVTFRDFVAMERLTLESEESRNFWEEELRDLNVTRLPRLPVPYRAPSKQRIREEYAVISPELSQGLHAVARSLKVPIKSVLLAAHQKVLSLLSGQRDVVTGLVTNGRPEALDGEQVRGMFLNTVPFRLHLPEGTWADLIRSTFESEWELLPHRRYPLLALQRKLGGQPLFEAQFNFVHFHVLEGVLRSGNVEVLREPRKRAFEEAHFLLTAAFGLNVFSSQVNLMLQYDSTELSEQQVRAITGYYVATLQRITNDLAECHNAHTPIPLAERQRLLTGWNDTARAYSHNACLHELFEAQAERTPHNVAVTSDTGSLTYRELNEQANQLAHLLHSLGVAPDARVALLMERSVDLIVALLGILKAGCAYVPLDPDYPIERLQFMLEDSGAAVLLTEPQLAVPELHGPRVIYLSSAEISQQSTASVATGVTSDNLAYIIYTSGSTGQPKGAMLPHRGIVNCVEWMQETYRLDEHDRFLCKTSLNFDASVWEVFWPLAAGASIFVARHAAQQDSAYLAGTIVKHGITFAYFVPSMLGLFVQEPQLAQASSLRKVICGGESLSAELVRRFYDQLSGADLHHSYGPTETSIAAAEYVCPRDGEWQVMPIGRPLGNNELYILNEGMQPVPVGVTGELYIGGEGLARGYHDRAGLTADKFVPDPFASEAGARLYRTGDLARYLPDGLVEFRGRVDSQVKLRGMRLELGEIEAALCEHARVRECAAILHGNGIDAQIVAYVVPAPDLNPEDLREYLGSKLPRHMVPAVFVQLDRLPLLPNGKLDRHALPAPDGQRPASPIAFVAPRNQFEQTVAEIWRDVLGIDQVGIHDNFFDLGGHSLRLLQVHLKLRQVLHREIPLHELFQYPTVSALATHLQTGGAGESLAASQQRGERRKERSEQQRQRRQTAKAAQQL